MRSGQLRQIGIRHNRLVRKNLQSADLFRPCHRQSARGSESVATGLPAGPAARMPVSFRYGRGGRENHPVTFLDRQWQRQRKIASGPVRIPSGIFLAALRRSFYLRETCSYSRQSLILPDLSAIGQYYFLQQGDGFLMAGPIGLVRHQHIKANRPHRQRRLRPCPAVRRSTRQYRPSRPAAWNTNHYSIASGFPLRRRQKGRNPDRPSAAGGYPAVQS